MTEKPALSTVEDLLLRGAVAQILERCEWWRTWEQDRELWVRDAGLWFVAQMVRHTLSHRPAMDEMLQDKTLVRLSQVSYEVHEDAKLKLQKKILRDLAETPGPSLGTNSGPYNSLVSYFEAQSLRDASRAMEERGDACFISWPTVRALYGEAQAMATQRLMAFIRALENDGQRSIQNLLPYESSEPTITTIAVLAQAVIDQLASVRVYVSNQVAELVKRIASVSDEVKCLEYEPFPTLLLLDKAISGQEQERLRAQFARLERQKISNSAGNLAGGDVALIDPFTYPYNSDETRVMNEEDAAQLATRVSLDPQERMLDGMFLDLKPPFVPAFVCSNYLLSLQSQWIPSDFQIDQDSHVTIQSYINNLNPLDHRRLYSSISRLFEAMLPLLKQELGPKNSIRGRQIQVVVTAMNMHLTSPTTSVGTSI